MSRVGLLILIASLVLTAVIAWLSHGHVLFVFLPLLIGAPLASLFRRRRR